MLEEEYMKYNHNRRIFRMFYAVTASVTLLTGFTSLAAERQPASEFRTAEHAVKGIAAENGQAGENGTGYNDPGVSWNFTEIVNGVQADAVNETMAAAGEARDSYLKKLEEERKAAEEARRLAEEEAARKAAAAAQSEAEKELLAALIFCEAGNQPYEGQVAVGAVVMNRVRSGSFPDTITDVIYQSGQFTPAMTGWLDSVLASGGYTESAMQAAEDALAGSSPVGGCLYFSTGGGGYQLGDHYFR